MAETNADSCLTCRLNRGDLPSPGGVIYQDDLWQLQHDIEPIALVGWLILKPLRHVEAFADLTPEEAAAFGPLTRRITRAMTEVLRPTKIYLSMYAEARGFAHLHVHLIPRDADIPPERRGPGIFAYLRESKASGQNRGTIAQVEHATGAIRQALLAGDEDGRGEGGRAPQGDAERPTPPAPPTLDDALALAAAAHRAQAYPTPGGEPFILHPIRVMLAVEGDAERIVAILHDVVEDTACTLDELRRAGYPGAVVDALDRLTHRAGETYEAYIGRVAADPIARRVKLADLADNLATNRRLPPTPDTRERIERYERARQRLRSTPDAHG